MWVPIISLHSAIKSMLLFLFVIFITAFIFGSYPHRPSVHSEAKEPQTAFAQVWAHTAHRGEGRVNKTQHQPSESFQTSTAVGWVEARMPGDDFSAIHLPSMLTWIQGEMGVSQKLGSPWDVPGVLRGTYLWEEQRLLVKADKGIPAQRPQCHLFPGSFMPGVPESSTHGVHHQ